MWPMVTVHVSYPDEDKARTCTLPDRGQGDDWVLDRGYHMSGKYRPGNARGPVKDSNKADIRDTDSEITTTNTITPSGGYTSLL